MNLHRFGRRERAALRPGVAVLGLLLAHCSSGSSEPASPQASGGAAGSTGGSTPGGALGGSSGGLTSGGTSGGASSGGSSSSGASAGGSIGGSKASNGGAPPSGGQAAGGMSALGGSGTGGTPAGGGLGGSSLGGSADGGKTGGSGGAAGVAGGGTGGVGGGSFCSKGQFLLCEDFESTAVGAIPSGWTKSGTPAVADDEAASGQRSLKLAGGDKGAGRILRSATAFGSGHYGRIFYRVSVPAPVPQSGVIHSTLVAFGGTSPTGGGNTEWRTVDTVEDSNGMHQFIYNVQPSGAEFGKGSAYDWKYDGMWHCAEWYIDAPTQTYRFYSDGSEVTQITISNGAGNFGSGENRSEIPESFAELRVGWVNYQSAGAGFTAWIDDLVIASSKIGCAR